MSTAEPHHLVALYDGDCGLCAKLVQFILPRDTKDAFRFAPLQSEYGQAALTRHGRPTHDFDTFVLITRPGASDEQVLDRSTAALAIMRRLGGLWPVAGVLGMIWPRFIRDLVYNLVAKNRFRFYGRGPDHCMIPSKENRAKFLAM